MAYAQKNYPEKLGNGPDTIATAGCFVTAIANLLAEFGIVQTPLQVNARLLAVKEFVDGDLVNGWGAVVKAYPELRLSKTGAGWPASSLSIVEFRYIENGTNMTHFCRAIGGTKEIVDSWDGVTCPSGYYGTPVGYATYAKVAPAPAKVTPIKAAPKPPAEKFIVAKSGDTVAKLSSEYHLSSANNFAAFLHLNPSVRNPNIIYAGTKYRVQ